MSTSIFLVPAIPGWFDNTPIELLRITWFHPEWCRDCAKIVEPWPKVKDANHAMWETSLHPGGKFTIKMTYDRAAFSGYDPKLAQREEINWWIVLLLVVIILILTFTIAYFSDGSYGGGISLDVGGSSGGSSCVCYCFCACASSGGAGCSSMKLTITLPILTVVVEYTPPVSAIQLLLRLLNR